jgi:hypothetical protein
MPAPLCAGREVHTVEQQDHAEFLAKVRLQRCYPIRPWSMPSSERESGASWQGSAVALLLSALLHIYLSM